MLKPQGELIMCWKCRVFRDNPRKSLWSFSQESGIGYSGYFHMSRANMLCKLRGYPFISKRISDEAQPFFCRSSDDGKWKRDRRKPYFSPEEWSEWLNEEP